MQNYLLVELQKSEGGESCWGQSNIGNQETGAASVSSHTSNKETCADTHSIPPSQASSSRKEPFLRPRGSGRLFFPILRTEELSVNTGLLNGFKNGASLRSRWTTIWRFTSLGHEKASTAESVRKTWSTRFLRKALASTYPWRKQQDKIRVLWGFQKILGLLSSNSRTLWWNAKWPWVDGVYSNSLDLERVFFTEVVFFSIQSILENVLIPGGHESDKGRQTVLFTPLNPFGGDSDEEEPRDDYTVPQKLHYHSHWKRDQDAVYCVKIIPSTRSMIAILANGVTCNHRTQSCASRLHPQSSLKSEIEYCSKDSHTHDQRRKSHWKQIGIRSSSFYVLMSWGYKETCAGEPIWDKRCQRRDNRWPD